MSPWELLDKPMAWLEWAEATMLAEHEARKQREASAARKGKR